MHEILNFADRYSSDPFYKRLAIQTFIAVGFKNSDVQFSENNEMLFHLRSEALKVIHQVVKAVRKESSSLILNGFALDIVNNIRSKQIIDAALVGAEIARNLRTSEDVIRIWHINEFLSISSSDINGHFLKAVDSIDSWKNTVVSEATLLEKLIPQIEVDTTAHEKLANLVCRHIDNLYPYHPDKTFTANNWTKEGLHIIFGLYALDKLMHQRVFLENIWKYFTNKEDVVDSAKIVRSFAPLRSLLATRLYEINPLWFYRNKEGFIEVLDCNAMNTLNTTGWPACFSSTEEFSNWIESDAGVELIPA